MSFLSMLSSAINSTWRRLQIPRCVSSTHDQSRSSPWRSVCAFESKRPNTSSSGVAQGYVESGQPIVDPHMHFWSFSSHPWLSSIDDNTIIAGCHFKTVATDYSQPDYFGDDGARELNIVKSVHVEATAQHPAMCDDPASEAKWVQMLHKEHGIGGDGIVAYAFMPDPKVCENQLKVLKRLPNLRGIRYNIDFHPTQAELRQTPRGDWMDDKDWQKSLSLIGQHQLSFDLQVHVPQLQRAAQLVREHDDVHFVLNHAGFPIVQCDRDFSLWKHGIETLAASPNVSAKISLAMSDGGPDHWVRFKGLTPLAIAESIEPFVDHVVTCFGFERSMFASNFPVDKLWCSLRDQYMAYSLVSARYSQAEQRQLFHDNAVACYRL